MTVFWYTSEESEHLRQLCDMACLPPRDPSWPAFYRRVASHSPAHLEWADEIECGFQRGETL